MTQALAVKTENALDLGVMESVIVKGELDKLTPNERSSYYNNLCKSLGLNPFTTPFEYITLKGKLKLYAKKDATEQLRKINGVSITDLIENEREGVFIVTAKAIDKDGRTDSAKGAVSIQGLKGDDLANAIMKAETKAKRRVTLSICGLGFLDETEVETIPDAKPFIETQPLQEEPQIIKELWATCRELNQFGDEVQWTKKVVLEYANQLFGSAYISIFDLKNEEKQFLLEDLQVRLNERKAISQESVDAEIVTDQGAI